jgi:competence CoiA-like predicted nuclease
MKQASTKTASINKGWNVPNGKVLFINEVDETMRGFLCNCICFGCGEKLIAALGDKNIDYFRHAGESNCKGGQETAHHQAAKEILIEKTFINT